MFSHRTLFLVRTASLLALAFLGLSISAVAQPLPLPDASQPETAVQVVRHQTSALTPILWLPHVAQPPSSIFGRVNAGGSPVGGIHVQLRFWDGSAYSTRLETSTDSSGSYRFLNPPTLASGQSYYVLYLNDTTGGNVSNASYLYIWGGPEITAYTGGQIAGGDFDIANILLVSPAPDATVTLPAAFQWQLRAATPSDQYDWELFNPNTNQQWMSGQLGYRNSISVSSLPAGVTYGAPYGWDVWVHDGHGGTGSSYYWRRITFSNAAVGGQSVTERATGSDRAARFEAARVAGRR